MKDPTITMGYGGGLKVCPLPARTARVVARETSSKWNRDELKRATSVERPPVHASHARRVEPCEWGLSHRAATTPYGAQPPCDQKEYSRKE
jgi:hypothetical protein